MEKREAILSFDYDNQVTLEVLLLPDKTYQVIRSESVMPYPDSWSILEILSHEYEERKNGKIVYRDAWDSRDTYCDSFQEVFDVIRKEASDLTELSPYYISDEYKSVLRDHVDLSGKTGKNIDHWKQQLGE